MIMDSYTRLASSTSLSVGLFQLFLDLLLAGKFQAQHFLVVEPERKDFQVNFHRLSISPAAQSGHDDFAAFPGGTGASPG